MRLVTLILIGIMASCTVDENPNAIAGLAPADVYLNMEKRGFTTTKNFSSEYGNSWDNTMSSGGIMYYVNTYSKDINSVESVKASVTITPPKKIEACLQFFMYVSSLPYEDSNPRQAAQWIENNFYNDEASTTIGDAKFTIYCPTEFARTLVIEKASPEPF